MGKRTNFERRERDYYPTPLEAVRPLVPHISRAVTFHEPCVGGGHLEGHLSSYGYKCKGRGDIATGQDALKIKECAGDVFITNPPWDWEILSPLIAHLSDLAPTWLLLNADLMHNKRMAKHMTHCVKVVSVGRVSWMNNGKKGFENAAWYLFDAGFECAQTQFYARAA